MIAKDDCRDFCYINSLGDKISNTAALIQPNPFWFWEKLFLSNSKSGNHPHKSKASISVKFYLGVLYVEQSTKASSEEVVAISSAL